MFTALGLFVKNKLFSTTGVFILVFVALFGVFIFSNTDTILTKFGFETKTSLRGKLSEAQKDLERLGDLNKQLNQSLEELQKQHERELEALKLYHEEAKAIEEAVQQIVEQRKTEARPVQKEVVQKTVTTDTTITLPRKEYNTLSKQNISSLHLAFSQLEAAASSVK